MRAPRLILDLSPSRVSLALVRRSAVVRAHKEPLDPARWQDAWADDLKPLDAPLAAALRALELEGQHARVELTYRADSVIAEVYSSAAPPEQALDAARLTLESSAPFPLEENACAFALLHRDGGAESAQTHVLALADASPTLQALRNWLERAGLTLAHATPSIAYTIHHALSLALQQPKDQTSGVLLMTAHDSVFLAATPGAHTLHFVRQIPVGVESFLAPLTRPLSRSAPQQPLTLSRDQAASYLSRIGLPMFDAEPDATTSLAPREALPLLQPPLQRLAVEVKQSLRFGLSDTARQSAALVLAGRATTIPNLEHRLAELSGATTREGAGDATQIVDGVTRVLSCGPKIPTLATPQAAARTASRRLVTAMYAGACAGSLFLLADSAAISRRAESTRRAIEEAAGLVSPLDLPDAAPEARALAQAVVAAAQDITAEDASRADWAALLADLATRLPPAVRLTSVVATTDDLTAIVDTAIASAESTVAPLQEAIAALRDSPLVRQVDLGPTSRDADSKFLRVSLRVTLWPAPRRPLLVTHDTP